MRVHVLQLHKMLLNLLSNIISLNHHFNVTDIVSQTWCTSSLFGVRLASSPAFHSSSPSRSTVPTSKKGTGYTNYFACQEAIVRSSSNSSTCRITGQHQELVHLCTEKESVLKNRIRNWFWKLPVMAVLNLQKSNAKITVESASHGWLDYAVRNLIFLQFFVY